MKKNLIAVSLIMIMLFCSLLSVSALYPDKPDYSNSKLDYSSSSISEFNYLRNNGKLAWINSYEKNGFIYERYYIIDTYREIKWVSLNYIIHHDPDIASSSFAVTNIEINRSDFEYGFGFVADGSYGFKVAQLDLEWGFSNSSEKQITTRVTKQLASKEDSTYYYTPKGKYELFSVDQRGTILTVKKDRNTREILKVEKVIDGTIGVSFNFYLVETKPSYPSC